MLLRTRPCRFPSAFDGVLCVPPSDQLAIVLQGRVACEINSGDELASTELIFGGVLTQLTPEEAVAVLSALVFQVCFARCCHFLQFFWSGKRSLQCMCMAHAVNLSMVVAEYETRMWVNNPVMVVYSHPSFCYDVI